MLLITFKLWFHWKLQNVKLSFEIDQKFFNDILFLVIYINRFLVYRYEPFIFLRKDTILTGVRIKISDLKSTQIAIFDSIVSFFHFFGHQF